MSISTAAQGASSGAAHVVQALEDQDGRARDVNVQELLISLRMLPAPRAFCQYSLHTFLPWLSCRCQVKAVLVATSITPREGVERVPGKCEFRPRA